MRVVVTEYKPDAPSEGYLKEGEDYKKYEVELSVEEGILLLQRLRSTHSRISFKGETGTTTFDLDPEGTISVEITSLNAFWAISEVSADEAESIVQTIYREDDFIDAIPGTDREWDAWGDVN